MNQQKTGQGSSWTESNDQTHMIAEWCPNCENEIEMRWNCKEDGYKAFCPVCGNRLMLCDECQHTDHADGGYCDYDGKNGTCRFNRDGETNRIIIAVKGGMVSNVYGSSKNINAEVIDCDTDDAVLAEEGQKTMDEIENDVAAGKLVRLV